MQRCRVGFFLGWRVEMGAAVEVTRGASALILAFPHVGTEVPTGIWAGLNDVGRALTDTDWHVDRLYAGLAVGATMVRARFHRYVVDANRGPDGVSLYPGQNTTGLVPETDFDGRGIWREGRVPSGGEIAERVARFHGPYHAALRAEVERVRGLHGVAVVYDCHSIRSRIPFLFEGVLPDINVGTNGGANGGTSCDAAIERAAVEGATAAAWEYTSVLNGRFKGGWTTRHYGQPALGVHAIQMELAQYTHLASETPPFAYDEAKADRLRGVLGDILGRVERAAGELRRAGNR
jgi:formiminoglutamase